jgi:hypothetical protein
MESHMVIIERGKSSMNDKEGRLKTRRLWMLSCGAAFVDVVLFLDGTFTTRALVTLEHQGLIKF